MNRICSKLQNKSGVTILMALLLLIVAITVSCVVLTAATTSARHINNDRINQQAYLTVGSAAELVRDELIKELYTVTETTSDTTSVPITEVTEADGDFAELINGGMEIALEGGNFSGNFSVTASNMDEVSADFSMDSERNIRIVFSLSEKDGYIMQLELVPIEDISTYTTSTGTGTRKHTTIITTTKYSWEARDIMKGAE